MIRKRSANSWVRGSVQVGDFWAAVGVVVGDFWAAVGVVVGGGRGVVGVDVVTFCVAVVAMQMGEWRAEGGVVEGMRTETHATHGRACVGVCAHAMEMAEKPSRAGACGRFGLEIRRRFY